MAKKKETPSNGDTKFKKGNKLGKKFTEEYQPSGEAKALGWLKKKTKEELKEEIIDKSFKIASEKLDREDLTAQEFLAIFAKAVEMSGFKNSKVDTTIKTYSLFEENVEKKANEID